MLHTELTEVIHLQMNFSSQIVFLQAQLVQVDLQVQMCLKDILVMWDLELQRWLLQLSLAI
jgi:hypothetical protein